MQRKKIQEAMKNVYFQKMTANGYHEIEEQIAKLQQQRPAKIGQLKAARALGSPGSLSRKKLPGTCLGLASTVPSRAFLTP